MAYFNLAFLILLPVLIKACSISIKKIQANYPGSSAYQYASTQYLDNGNYAVFYTTSSQNACKGMIFNSNGTNITSELQGNGVSSGSYCYLATLTNSFVYSYSTGSQIKFKIFSNLGLTTFPDDSVSTVSTLDIAKVAALSGGGFVIAYCTSNQQDFYVRVYNDAGIPLTIETKVNNYTGYRFFGISGLSNGNFVIVYTMQSGQGYYGAVFTPSLTRVTNDIQMNSENGQNFYDIAGLSSGGFVFAYLDSSTSLRLRGFNSDGTIAFSDSTPIATSISNWPSIAVSSGGGFAVSYYKLNSVRIQLFLNDGTNVLGDTSLGPGNLAIDSGATFLTTGHLVVTHADSSSQNMFSELVTINSCGVLTSNSLGNVTNAHNVSNNSLVTNTSNSTTNTSNSSNLITNNTNSTNNVSNSTNSTNPKNSTQSSNSTSNSTQSNNTLTPTSPTNPTGVSLSNETVYIQPTALKAVAAVAATAVGTSVSSSFIAGANPTLLWGLMGFLQQFFYLLFLNVDLPDNLQAFLSIFSFANLDFMPNMLKIFELPKLSSPKNFYDNDFTGLFLETTAPTFQLWLLLFFATVFLSFMRRQTYLSVRIRTVLLQSFPIRIWIDSVPTFLIAGCLQLGHFKFSDPFQSASLVIGILMILFVIVTPLIFWKIIHMNKKTLMVKALYEDFDMNHAKNKYYPVYEIVKKIAAASMIVLVYNWPIHQVLGLAIINTFYFGCLLISKPRTSKGENNFYLLLEFLSLVIHLSISFFHYEMSDEKKEILGYLVIATISLVVILSVMPMLYTQVQLIKKFISKSSRYKVTEHIQDEKKIKISNPKSQSIEKVSAKPQKSPDFLIKIPDAMPIVQPVFSNSNSTQNPSLNNLEKSCTQDSSSTQIIKTNEQDKKMESLSDSQIGMNFKLEAEDLQPKSKFGRYDKEQSQFPSLGDFLFNSFLHANDRRGVNLEGLENGKLGAKQEKKFYRDDEVLMVDRPELARVANRDKNSIRREGNKSIFKLYSEMSKNNPMLDMMNARPQENKKPKEKRQRVNHLGEEQNNPISSFNF